MPRNQASFTLDPKIKKKWVNALRSGKFKQGRGALYDSIINGYCCLGVLCVIAGIPKRELIGKAFPQQVGLNVEGFSTDRYLGSSSAWMVQYGKHKELTPLSEINDHHKSSFARIADIIEKRVGTH